MAETRDYKVSLRFSRGYEFVATFPDGEGLPPIVFDEPPPLGEGSGPNAAAVLAAAIGDCLAASFAFCLRKGTSRTARHQCGSRRARGAQRAGTVPYQGHRRGARAGSARPGSAAARALRATLRGFLHRHRERAARHSRHRESGGAEAGEGDCMTHDEGSGVSRAKGRSRSRTCRSRCPVLVRPSSRSPRRRFAAPTCTSCAANIRSSPASCSVTSRSASSTSWAQGSTRHYRIGERVIVGAITPCGQCFYCLNGSHSQCGGPLGGWRFGNTINGAWAEYLLVPDARANLAPIPADLDDESVLMCPDIFSTGSVRRRERQHQSRRLRWRSLRRARSACAPRSARN